MLWNLYYVHWHCIGWISYSNNSAVSISIWPNVHIFASKAHEKRAIDPWAREGCTVNSPPGSAEADRGVWTLIPPDPEPVGWMHSEQTAPGARRKNTRSEYKDRALFWLCVIKSLLYVDVIILIISPLVWSQAHQKALVTLVCNLW